MKFGLFSISTLDLIPLCKQITDHLSDPLHEYNVELVACRFDNAANYNANVQITNLGTLYSRQDFHVQSVWFKIRKYLKLIYKCTAFYAGNRSAVVYTTDLSTLNILLWFKFIFFFNRIFVIYHQFEMADLEVLSRFNRINFKLFTVLKNYLDLFIAPERNRLAYFIDNSGFDAQKTLVFANTTGIVRRNERQPDEHNTVTIAHVGIAGGEHYVGEFLKIIQKIGEKRRIKVHFIGYLPAAVMQMIDSYRLPFVEMIGDIPHVQLLEQYKNIDIGVILYRDLGLNYRYCAPNKLYEYWANGIFVIAHRLEGLIEVFTDEDMGVLCNMDDAADFEEKLFSAIDGANETRRQGIRNAFAIEYEIGKYMKQFEKILVDNKFGWEN